MTTPEDSAPTFDDLFTQALSDKFTGAYSERRMTQREVAEKAGLSLATIQRLFKGQRGFGATQVVQIATAIGVDPEEYMRAARLEAQRRMSEAAPDNVTQLTRKKQVDEMSVDEIEALPHAATRDPEMDTDEQFD